MNLRKLFNIPWPKWKVIRLVGNSGRCIMDDGTIARKISNVQLKAGDKVLVYLNQILKIHVEDIRYVPLIRAIGELLIICHVGDTTGSFNKKYYTLINSTLTEINSLIGWTLTDDGKYGLIWDDIIHDDPNDYNYLVEGTGINVPSVINGIAAKQQTGKQARYLLNTAMEDEMFKPWTYQVVLPGSYDYTYNFLQLEDSLIFAPYRMKSKPFVSRYVDDGLITIPHQWAGANGTLYLNSYQSDSFIDSIPKTPRIYHSLFDEGRTYKEISGDGASVGVVNYYEDKDHIQDIVRADTFLWFTSEMAEPVQKEKYSFTEDIILGDEYHRCSDPENNECYFVDGGTISGQTIDPVTHLITDTGLSTIANDIKLIFSACEDGELDYVRSQKDTEMTTFNTGIYCKDTLVEESGWEDVTVLYRNEPPTFAELNRCPVFVRKTCYQILHAHHSEIFDALVYRKTKYVSHNSELLDYMIYRSWVGDYTQVRKTFITSITTFHIYVNGKIYNLPYECNNTEYHLTGLSEVYTGTPLPITTYLQALPWCDIEDADNCNLTRIFTTDTKKQLLIGFDVFPVAFKNNLTYTLRNEYWGYYTLDAIYDDSEISFPPSSDSTYENTKDRKWLLFNDLGNMEEEITPPAYKRINGLLLLDPKD